MRAQADPFSLDAIKNEVMSKALAAQLYQPLRTFFMRMYLVWSDTTETASAQKVGDKAIIALGRKFFAEHVHTLSHTADIVWHEIMHPILRLQKANEEINLLVQKHGKEVVDIAQDMIINAVLHTINCAGFMEQYYADEDINSFLRPNSKLGKQDQSLRRQARSGQSEKTRRRLYECQEFYRKLYGLRVTLEESVDFIEKHFDIVTITVICLGCHDDLDGDYIPIPVDGGILNGEELEAVRKALKIEKVTRNNFNEVIRKVSENLGSPGTIRTGTEITRRMPATLSRSDMINIERGRNRFTRSDYRLRRVCLLIDVSGSMSQYIAFMVGLVIGLNQREVTVRAICWADRPVEVSFDDLKRGNIPPETGCGTQGEALARYIEEQELKRVVIITDNYAGDLSTSITSQVELCLIDNAKSPGTFDNRHMVPQHTVHHLRLKIPV